MVKTVLSSQVDACPCDPAKDKSGRCSCYVCVGKYNFAHWRLPKKHAPIYQKDNAPNNNTNLEINKNGNKYYARDIRCGDVKNNSNFTGYIWDESGGPNSPGNNPKPIMYEGGKKIKPSDSVTVFMSSAEFAQIFMKNNGKNFTDPCIESGKKYGLCWYVLLNAFCI